jgi:hypothetical protein
MRRATIVSVVGLIVVLLTSAGIEGLSSLVVPPWPARALRWSLPINPVSAGQEPFASRPWMAEPFNSWGMRDKERTIERSPSYATRAVFIGDSFVESSYLRQALPAAIENELSRIEAINLGVSATDPPSYYYRLRDVGVKLSPDVALIFIYMGNDFVLGDEAFGASRMPPIIGSSEGQSLLGAMMPRTRWLLKNREPVFDALWKRQPPPGEEARLYQMRQGSRAVALKQLSAYMKEYYQPHLSVGQIKEVLSRADDRLWRNLEKQESDSEFLMGWTLDNILTWEAGTFPVPTSQPEAHAVTPDSIIDATLSWISAIERVASSHGVRSKVFAIPVGSVDPEYVDFWRPWPRSFAWNRICDDREERLVSAAAQAGIELVRLREVLAGEPGTYRKRDGHWTEKGQAIAARRIALELKKLGY